MTTWGHYHRLIKAAWLDAIFIGSLERAGKVLIYSLTTSHGPYQNWANDLSQLVHGCS